MSLVWVLSFYKIMKTLITLLLLTTLSYSQEYNRPYPYASISFDLKNGIIGSDPTDNKAEIDVLIRFGAISNENLQIGIVYEKFKRIDFNKYAFEIGHRIGKSKVQVTPTIEAGWIERYKLNYWTLGGNLHVNYNLNDNLALIGTGNLSWRTDLDSMYGGTNIKPSFYVGLQYNFNLQR